MKICGIICEYNPLHNGHIRHIEFSRRNADTVVCVMSGDFTQRGTPAIMDKYARAKHAVLAGADLVLELPAVFSVASAENFAYGGVRLLGALKCGCISFGSECGDIGLLERCADVLLNPPPPLKTAIKRNIALGLSYPAAVARALAGFDPELNLLDKPNNLLAVEYLKQIKNLGLDMQPVTIKRGDNYNATSVEGDFASATALRHALCTGDAQNLEKYLPPYVVSDLIPSAREKYQQFVYSFMNTATPKYLSAIEGVTEGIENRILANVSRGSYAAMISAIKTKRYTLVKLQRILLCAILGITKETVAAAKETKPYPRVLAVRKDRMDLLSHIAREGVGTLTAPQKELAEIDVRASNIYSSLHGMYGNRDLTTPLQKI